MGLQFVVGAPEEVFESGAADKVRNYLSNRFGSVIRLNDDDPYESEEVGWSGWSELQGIAAKLRILAVNLGSMEAWCGAFLPVNCVPENVRIQPDHELSLASLHGLSDELHAIARKLNLPIDNKGIDLLIEQYQEDEMTDQDMGVQTYLQLLPSVRIAMSRSEVLWVVK
jgi:hypothetical protein